MVSLSDRIIIKLFNAARKFYTTFFGKYILPQPIPNRDPTFANKTIYDLLSSDKPCMIGRFGSNEIECTVFTRNRKYFKYDMINYVTGGLPKEKMEEFAAAWENAADAAICFVESGIETAMNKYNPPKKKKEEKPVEES